MAELSCYNRGCGKIFDPANNPDGGCCYHPGMPYFHDVYKGWNCCSKKSVDFTEFLNIPGCTKGKHSNVKPIEAEKLKQVEDIPEIEPARFKPKPLKRPDFNSPCETITPQIAPALIDAINNLPIVKTKKVQKENIEIPPDTICKNSGCNCIYESSNSDSDECVHHPGYPVFHEGLKFWTCCTKRTTDFTTFMNQVGCTIGTHKWIKDDNSEQIKCRYDWHQTATNVIVAIYAKMYHYEKSYVKMNPIRLNVNLVFPQQNNGEFNLDLELRGIIDVNKSSVQMLGPKIEIIMPKAEPGLWPQLNFPSKQQTETNEHITPKDDENYNTENDSDIDLDDVNPTGSSLTEIF